MTEELRVAVVGAGGWGRQHARVFSSRPDTTLCAVVGRTYAKTQQRADEFATTPYTDIEEMLADQRPDLVAVCLPNEGHFDATLQLVRTGVPLLVEKPLVFELEQADTLLQEAERSGTFFAINFNHRYAEPVLRARAAIDAGELGDLTFASWRFGGEASVGSSPHANLIETQCHGFDMLEHLCGPISSVMAQMTSKTYGDWSTLAVAVEFSSGAVGTMVGSYDSSYAYPDAQLVEINGTSGRAVISDTVRSLSLSTVGDETERRWQAGYFNDEARSFHGTFDRHVEAVLTALRAGAEPPVHARAGRRALELAVAVIASHQRGVRVETAMPSPGSR